MPALGLRGNDMPIKELQGLLAQSNMTNLQRARARNKAAVGGGVAEKWLDRLGIGTRERERERGLAAGARSRHRSVVDGCSTGRTRRRSHTLLTKSASWVAGSDGTHIVEAGAIDGRTVDTASRVAGLDAVAVVTVIALAIERAAKDGVTQSGIVVAFVIHPDVCKIPRRIECSLALHFRF